MANYFLSVDTSNFKPFTYQEKIAPFLDYEKNYLDTREEIQRYIDEYGNFMLPEGYAGAEDVAAFNEQAQQAFNNFSISGLNKNTSRELSKIFTGYGKISELKKNYERFNEAKNKATDDSKTHIVDEVKWEDFINGATPQYNRISREEAYTMAMNTMAALNSAESNIEIQKVGYGLLNVILHGPTSMADITNILADPTLSKGVGLVALQIFNSMGGQQLKSDSAQKELMKTIVSGMIAGNAYKNQILEDSRLAHQGSGTSSQFVPVESTDNNENNQEEDGELRAHLDKNGIPDYYIYTNDPETHYKKIKVDGKDVYITTNTSGSSYGTNRNGIVFVLDTGKWRKATYSNESNDIDDVNKKTNKVGKNVITYHFKRGPNSSDSYNTIPIQLTPNTEYNIEQLGLMAKLRLLKTTPVRQASDPKKQQYITEASLVKVTGLSKLKVINPAKLSVQVQINQEGDIVGLNLVGIDFNASNIKITNPFGE